jgi:hypothetical protein
LTTLKGLVRHIHTYISFKAVLLKNFFRDKNLGLADKPEKNLKIFIAKAGA